MTTAHADDRVFEPHGFVATSRRSPRTWNERSVGSGSYLPVCRLRRRSWPSTAAGSARDRKRGFCDNKSSRSADR
jgi:hypothetical protein